MGIRKQTNIYLSFTAERAKLGKYDIEAFDVIIDARDGVFTVANYKITLGGRPISFNGYVNANTDPPTYLFAGKIEGETIEALINLQAVKRLGEYEDIANVVDFFLKKESDFVTGQTLYLGGVG